MKRKILVITLAFAMIFSMAACGKTTSRATENTLMFAVDSLPSIDPQQFNSAKEYPVMKALFEGLVRTNGQDINPGMAESWEVSDDNMKMTFHIRKDACWSDGEKLTANDFVYSFRRLADPENGFAYSWALYEIKNYDQIAEGKMSVDKLGVEATDDYTFVINFCTPAPYYLGFLDLPCFYPVRQDQVEEFGEEFAMGADKFIGNGPYTCSDLKVDQQVDMVASENYWNKDAIKLDGATCLVIDDEAAFAMLESGDLDFADIPTAIAPDYNSGEKTLEGCNIDSFMSGASRWFSINCASETNPILGEKEFRQALNYGFDRDEYIKIATNGLYSPATRITIPAIAGTNGGTFCEQYPVDTYKNTADVEKAKECLQKAMDNQGIKDPSEITISLKIEEGSLESLIAENFQDQWSRNLGINVNIETITYKAQLDDRVNGDFDIIYAGWVPDYDDPYTYLSYFVSSNAQNGGKFTNARFDELINTANTYPEQKTRLEMYGEAEKILMDEAGCIPVHLDCVPYAYKSNLKGLTRYHLGSQWEWFECSFE